MPNNPTTDKAMPDTPAADKSTAGPTVIPYMEARADPGEAAHVSQMYETDLSAWAEQQARLLRRAAAGEHLNNTDLDWLNLAEEIEAVSRSERRELRKRMARLIQHLLKWKFQPNHRSRSWSFTIIDQRQEINDLLEDNTSLLRTIPEVLPKAYQIGRAWAAQDTGLLNLPEVSPFDWEQILNGELSE